MKHKIAALCVASILACQAEVPATEMRTESAPGTDSATARADRATAAPERDAPERDAPDERAAILFLGTSLTAGYGVGADAAFPALIQQRIDSAGAPYRVVNAGLSGETSAGGLRRLAWSLQDSVAVLVLELGANDGLRGLPVAQMRANLDSILARTRARYPDVQLVIAGMEAPPNLGPQYTSAFRRVFTDLAEEYDAALVPFLLTGVAGVAELNQEDGLHPTAEGHRIIADNVWPVLDSVLAVQRQ